MDKKRLHACRIVYGDTNESLAEALGIAVSTLYSKTNGNTAFTFPEVEFITERYGLTYEEAWLIFGKNF